jgi:Cactus-binding C-terminus of cactin protein
VKEPGNEETVLLHFSAGPPYEDIAFRIVNREWEYSHKRLAAPTLPESIFDVLPAIYRGFRSSFDRGCLSLWFNFRRNVSLSSLSTRLDNVLTACSSTANSHT